MTRALLSIAIASVAMPLAGQAADFCRDMDRWRDRGENQCEVREYTLTDVRNLSIAGGTNGGITVDAWDRNEILVQAVVVANAETIDRAREITGDIEVSANSSRLSADGPRNHGRESWWVAWHIHAPAGTSLDLETLNGGIRIAGMTGTTRFRATNGGVTLADMAGDVSGSTTNGGLHIELTGTRWTGTGLDVRATNGGVRLSIPDDYSGEFETGTVNGRLDLGFPIMVQGRFGGRELQFRLGEGGGPRLRASTTNGGVRISRG